MSEPLLEFNSSRYPKFRSGKVRELFDLGERLAMVATDRISAFDCVIPSGIPGKGRALTALSKFWFEKTAHIVPNHWLSTTSLPEEFAEVAEQTLLVSKLKPLPVECVVRGYLSGSGWAEYQREGAVCGVELPRGLKESEELPDPIFTPATKAVEGHDENISFERMLEWVSEPIAGRLRELSLELYRFGREWARARGVIIADTKFEFGLDDAGEIYLIDEALTPDSSRFWKIEDYEVGQSQRSFDKQFVRDYLNGLVWDKSPPAPALPEEIVAQTAKRYLEAERILTMPPVSG